MKAFRLVALVLLLAACQDQTVASTSLVDTTAPAPRPSTTSPTTSDAPVTTVIPIEAQSCVDGNDALICEVYDLIVRRDFDPVDDAYLAAAASAEVDALERDSGAAPECVIPNEAFEIVCAAMSDEGVTTGEAEIAAVQGMLGLLDPNTFYLSPDALRLLEEDQSGSVEGIGALVGAEDQTADPAAATCGTVSQTCRLVVISTFADGPVRLAGLEVDDVLVAVDGESILGWTVDEVTAAVRGPAGTRVELSVDRAGTSVDLAIIRAAITIPVVETDQVGDVGYLRLNLFTDTSDREVHNAIEDLLGDGAERLVLDLRDNPGGALHATIEIASEFMSDGVVVRTEGPDEDFSYEADPGGLLADTTPMVILVNQGSASASEVLAAALQERDRALVIGTATFGKNTVQQRYGLSDGGALKLTVARWVTEAGSDFGETGVLPDIEAVLDSELTVDELVAEVTRLSGW
ncbi:hypothetical protein BH18ACT5_BH18ACT5_07040 [soil metagenome]